MKRIFTVLLAVVFATICKAQLFMIPYFTGTSLYGSYGVTVTSAGSVSSSGGSTCIGAATDQYWIGPGGVGDYLYTLSKPIYQIEVFAWGINGGTTGAGEYMSMYVNGAPYPLTAANMVSYTECGGFSGGPCYLSSGDLMGPVGTSGDYNGGTFIITSCTGIHSFECYTNGILSGVAYTVEIDSMRTTVGCVYATNNSPCIFDTLQLDMVGDSTNCTYIWSGPGGFTSTLQDPFIFPATFPDSGLYTCIRNDSGTLDTSSTRAIIHPKPTIALTSNAPLCTGFVDTLKLFATPDSTGEVFYWTGPASFSDSAQNPTRTGYSSADTGEYLVVATTQYGCQNTDSIDVGIVPPPRAPFITGVSSYCQGAVFVPFTVDSFSGTVYWYPTATGGTGSTVPSVVSTVIPGNYTVYADQLIGSCESPRDSFKVRIITTPPAPTITGDMQYCQYIGPFVPLTVVATHTGTADWYTVATGGTGSVTEPPVNIDVTGTYNFWVNQTDSGCIGPRAPVTIVVHPKPNPPVVTGQGPYCQFQFAPALIASVSEAGDGLTWFGPGIVSAGTTLTPTPQTDTAEIDSYYVNETSVYGCVSNNSIDTVRIISKPGPPHVDDTTYCQTYLSAPLNYQVDSLHNSYLTWYVDATVISTPLPSTVAPGITTWYVTQTVQTCQSDSVPVKVTVITLPQFAISTKSPWVCQQDSIWLSYHGTGLAGAAFQWTIPVGDSFATGYGNTDSLILVKFDSVSSNAYFYLKASDDGGFCATIDTVKIKVVSAPTSYATTKNDVCIGDTVQLSLGGMSDNAESINWTVDYNYNLLNAPGLTMISAGSGSSGPYMISWVDTGIHVLQVNTYSTEGCTSLPTFDTVDVHQAPDATFKMELIPNTLCIQDSVFFVANSSTVPNNYNYSYVWSPAHSFTNVNQSSAWGRVEESNTIISLTVTDPFGCSSTASTELEPGSCCTVNFPNAFTPNGDSHNDFFRPLFTGYHNFHVFRIQNRWGQTVFETTAGDMKWDGTFNGVPQDMGVYFYYIKYDCGGKTIEESGDVTLIR